MWGTCFYLLGWEDPLEEGMAAHSSVLTRKIPKYRGVWQVTVHGVTVRHDWATKRSRAQHSTLPLAVWFYFLLGYHLFHACMHAKSPQLCPTLCDPIDGSQPDFPVSIILQARTLEWIAVSFSKACMHAKLGQSCPTLWDPIDSSQPGSSEPRTLQARTLEWIAIAFCIPVSGLSQICSFWHIVFSYHARVTFYQDPLI